MLSVCCRRSGEGAVGMPEGPCFIHELVLFSNMRRLSESDPCHLGACEHRAGLIDCVVTITSTVEIHGLGPSTVMQN